MFNCQRSDKDSFEAFSDIFDSRKKWFFV